MLTAILRVHGRDASFAVQNLESVFHAIEEDVTVLVDDMCYQHLATGVASLECLVRATLPGALSSNEGPVALRLVPTNLQAPQIG